MLKVKRLTPEALLPEVAHPGEDLGFDLFASVDIILLPNEVTRVPTGIAVEFTKRGMGALLRDRSSMAGKKIFVTAGVLDWGYRGELMVLMTNYSDRAYSVQRGDKIAQMIPIESLTHMEVLEVNELGQSTRGIGGFGSTGK